MGDVPRCQAQGQFLFAVGCYFLDHSIDGWEGSCLFSLPGMADQARCPVEPPFATGHTPGAVGLRA